MEIWWYLWAFDGIYNVGNTFTTGGHLVVFMWAFDGIILLRWGTHSQQVVFRWTFGGIQVGKTWGLFWEKGNSSGPPSKYHVGPSYRQRAKTSMAPAGLAHSGPMWQPSLGPPKANVEC